jgi:hypothetical protein
LIAAARARVSGAWDGPLMDMSTSSQAAPLPSPNPKAIVGVLGSLAVAVITIVAVSDVVDWSAAQTALLTGEAAPVKRKQRDGGDITRREQPTAPANRADTRIHHSSGQLVVIDERPAIGGGDEKREHQRRQL